LVQLSLHEGDDRPAPAVARALGRVHGPLRRRPAVLDPPGEDLHHDGAAEDEALGRRVVVGAEALEGLLGRELRALEVGPAGRQPRVAAEGQGAQARVGRAGAGQRLLDEVGSRGLVPGDEEAPAQRGDEAEGEVGAVDRERVLDGGGEVGPLGAEAGQPVGLLATHEAALDRGDEGGEVLGVPQAGGLGLPALEEAGVGVVLQGLQHAVAHAGGPVVGEHERLVDEAADEVGHVAGGDGARVCAHDLGRVQRRPTAERRQPPEHDLFGRLEEVVAPVDQAAQRLLAGLDPAAAAGEEREAVVEASGDVDERERAQPGRGELDGERQPVEALDQLHGEGLLLRPDREVGPDRGGSRRQQVQGLVAG
jgi:hypothetical protein